MAELHLFVDFGAPPTLPDAVTFETRASQAQVVDTSLWAYNHHGADFGQADTGALTCLFEDLVLGRPMPTKFVAGQLDIDVIVAATLFLHRALLPLPATLNLVAQVDFVHRRGFNALPHVESSLGSFLRLLSTTCSDEVAPKRDLNARLQMMIEWVREYLAEDRLPALPVRAPVPTILDTGAGGFVVAETTGSLPDAWVEMYRLGYYRGIVFGPRKDALPTVLVARKSAYVPLDLNRAAYMLNEAEKVFGGVPAWAVEQDWLWGPPSGTAIPPSGVIEAVVGVEVSLVPPL